MNTAGAKASLTGQQPKESATDWWRVSSDRSEVDALGQPREARSELSIDKPTVGGLAPLNKSYIGWASVANNIGNRLAGRSGWLHAKDEAALQRFIDKHYKGDAADRPMFSRAQTADQAQADPSPAKRAADHRHPCRDRGADGAGAQAVSRAVGLERVAVAACHKGAPQQTLAN